MSIRIWHITNLLQIVWSKRYSAHADRSEERQNISTLQGIADGRLQHLPEGQVRHRPRGGPRRLARLLLLLLPDGPITGRGPDVILHLGVERPRVRAHLGGPVLALSCGNHARPRMDPQEVALQRRAWTEMADPRKSKFLNICFYSLIKQLSL